VMLVKAGNFDICIFAGSASPVRYKNGIHVWIRATDEKNTNLMILLGYIIMAHPDWHKSHIKIFNIIMTEQNEEAQKELEERIASGRLPITLANIEMMRIPEKQTLADVVDEHSKHAGLTIIGFREESMKRDGAKFFNDFQDIGDILFVNASQSKEIK